MKSVLWNGPLRVWLATAPLTFVLTRAAAALALLLLGLSPASGAAAQAPLTAEDLGPEWFFGGEIWGDAEPGTALSYAAGFGRDPLQGLSGGPITVNLGIELLTETPPADAVDRGMAQFLESLDNFLGSLGPAVEVSFFDGPAVGTNSKWVRFGVNLEHLVPDTPLPPPGVAYGVGFEAGTNTAGVVTIGFLDKTTPDDTAAIARIVAERLQEIRRPAG